MRWGWLVVLAFGPLGCEPADVIEQSFESDWRTDEEGAERSCREARQRGFREGYPTAYGSALTAGAAGIQDAVASAALEVGLPSFGAALGVGCCLAWALGRRRPAPVTAGAQRRGVLRQVAAALRSARDPEVRARLEAWARELGASPASGGDAPAPRGLTSSLTRDLELATRVRAELQRGGAIEASALPARPRVPDPPPGPGWAGPLGIAALLAVAAFLGLGGAWAAAGVVPAWAPLGAGLGALIAASLARAGLRRGDAFELARGVGTGWLEGAHLLALGVWVVLCVSAMSRPASRFNLGEIPPPPAAPEASP